MNVIATIEKEIERLMAAEGDDAINCEVSRARAIEGMVKTINETQSVHLSAAKLAFDMGLGATAERMLGAGNGKG